MPVEVVRGFEGKANCWSMGQEGGFIAYIRGSIGDKPAPIEGIILGDTSKFEDIPLLSESVVCGNGKTGDDTPRISESWTITNS